MDKIEFDIFNNSKIYPKADQIFQTALEPLQTIKNDCVFILDTNALLLPYSTGAQSLLEISQIYERLKEGNKLKVPAQVAREFAKNRPVKLKEIFQQVNRKRNSLPILSIGPYPLLEDLPSYKEALKLEKEFKELLEKYKKAISNVVETVKNWTWNDPVSLLYRKIFTPELIIEVNMDEKKIKEDLLYRYQHKIPPGYKDEGKSDDGVGDFLIWLSILEVGKQKKDVVFVSGDEKADWYYNSENQALYPRFELLSEFQHVSENRAFHIIKLSDLLKILGADKQVVEEIAVEEKSLIIPQKLNSELSAELAVYKWLKLEYPKCEIYFNHSNSEYPDLEVLIEGGYEMGVEIKLVKSDLEKDFYLIKKGIIKSLEKFNTSIYSKLTFVFVTTKHNYKFAALNSYIQKIIYKENVAAVDIETIYGYIDDDVTFFQYII